MKITSKGRVTIPQEIRERFGFLPGTEVEFVVKGNDVQIVKSRRPQSRRSKLIRRMLGTATTKMTTDEIMKLTRG
jgi:AbrB family looped-hinge helix DNA binding protein